MPSEISKLSAVFYIEYVETKKIFEKQDIFNRSKYL